MKIAYLLGSLNRGGTETLLLDVFKNADKAGFEFIGIHRKGGVLKDDFYAAGQRFFRLAPRFPFDVFYFYKLRKLLKKEQIDIVHAQQHLDAIYTKIACLGTNIKIVQTLHGYDDLSGKKIKLISLSFKLTDKNIFVSNFQKDYYTEKYCLIPENQTTVYNGISFEKFDRKYNVPDFLKKIDSDARRLQICMVGNFVRVREQNTVCKFLKLLREADISFDFYFVGKKDEKEPWRYDNCVRYCEENGLNNYVHFLGARADVPAILQNMDAFVYSTDHDTFGIAVIEAIACGLPVFVNDWGVMNEITNNGEWTTLYKTENEQDLLSKFAHFLKNREAYNEKAQIAAIGVRKKYNIETHINNLQQVYQSIINKN